MSASARDTGSTTERDAPSTPRALSTPCRESKPALRPYQLDTIARTRAAMVSRPAHERRVVVHMATGSGKTFTSAELISRVESQGKRTLFVCDTLELVDQALRAFDAYGLRVGVMQARHERTNHTRPTQVCSQATLAGMIKRGELDEYQVDLIVIDECHQQYRVRDRLAELYPTVPVIGLTATPFARGMGQFYREIVSAVPMQTLIDDGYLADYVVYAPSQPSMTGVSVSGRDWQADAAAEAYDGPLVADIVRTWLEHGRGRRTLLFACNVAHSKHLVRQFVAAGVNAVHVDGYPESPDDVERRANRHETIQRYRDGNMELLSSVTLCTKGFDAPETSCIVLARPTKSLSLYWQMVGRGLRTAPGKADCVVLDHAGNCLRHGYPTDAIAFELDDGSKTDAKLDRREKGEKLPKPCPKCSRMKPVGQHACPTCGFAPERQSDVENVDGELVPVRELKARQSKPATPDDKHRWWCELKTIADLRGKSESWAHAQFRSKFSEWPAKRRPTIVMEPSAEVLGFIKSRQIAWAKSQQARAGK